jgi:superfamily I DNA and/or RNA helicase
MNLATDYDFDVSLFERLLKNGVPYVQLQTQHRMRPEVACLLRPHIYAVLRDHESVSRPPLSKL